MKQLRFVIPIMIFVFILAMRFLDTNYAEIENRLNVLIALCGALFSGVITFFMFSGKEK